MRQPSSNLKADVNIVLNYNRMMDVISKAKADNHNHITTNDLPPIILDKLFMDGYRLDVVDDKIVIFWM